MLDAVGLIHMNGRVYDPTIGRFLSADPFIQAPNNLQSYNRYSYVINNPLRYTDPSGYIFKSIKKAFKSVRRAVKKYWRPLVSIALTAWLPGSGLLAKANTFWTGALTGAAAGTVTGGSRGAWTGLLTGGLLHGAGKLGNATKLFSKLGAKKVLTHGLIGGINSKLMGGKFAHGFAAMGFTQGANIQFGNTGMLGSAAIGGVASELAGGSFKYGAIQGAMSYGLNDCLHGEHCTFVPPSLHNGFVNAVAGFGDAIFSVATLGFGELSKVRGYLGSDAVVDPNSLEYTGGYAAGALTAAVAPAGAVPLGFRSQGPLRVINQNRYFRIGYNRHGGRRVFRVGGQRVEQVTGKRHIDLGDGGPL